MDVLWNVIAVSVCAERGYSWRILVNYLVPFVCKTFFMNYKQWFLVNLLDDELNSANRPNIINGSDINLIIDFKFWTDFQLLLPLFICVFLLLPNTLKCFVAALLNQLSNQVINCKTRHCRFVPHNNTLIAIKVTHKAILVIYVNFKLCTYRFDEQILIETHFAK